MGQLFTDLRGLRTVVVRVEVKPALLAWAQERSKTSREALSERFTRLADWETGEVRPTLRQLEAYGRATHTPVGLLLLSEPPEESVPIPDFRTIGGTPIGRPSADLLDTIYLCEQRQEWYRDFARANREDPVPFVGSATVELPIADAAADMRDVLSFDLQERNRFPSWSAALSGLIERAEDAGVLVMASGIVGSNTHRKLDPREFRGFSLVDPLAPVVFINGADSKAAQIFTLAHELSHIWLGSEGLDDPDLSRRSTDHLEQWCNQVAAEFLVPIDAFHDEFDPNADLAGELDRLARFFRVSTLVVLRRAYDDDRMTWNEYRAAFVDERERVVALQQQQVAGGGNFFNSTPIRTSKRFARAILTSTAEGHTLSREAARLLGFKRISTLTELGHHLGVT